MKFLPHYAQPKPELRHSLGYIFLPRGVIRPTDWIVTDEVDAAMWRDRNLGTTLIKLSRTVRQHAASRRKLPIASVSRQRARQKVYIGNIRTRGRRRGFRVPGFKADEHCPRYGVVKNSAPRGACRHSRFPYLRRGTHDEIRGPCCSLSRSRNSSSGDPYPTNFQIINISVAALLRAS